jgi:hypothetical protein
VCRDLKFSQVSNVTCTCLNATVQRTILLKNGDLAQGLERWYLVLGIRSVSNMATHLYTIDFFPVEKPEIPRSSDRYLNVLLIKVFLGNHIPIDSYNYRSTVHEIGLITTTRPAG